MKDILFIHIPKNAGTSIAVASRDIGCFVKGHDFRKSSFVEMKDLPPLILKQYITFAVVRNPWDRLWSAFNYLNSGGRNIDDYRDSQKFISKFGGNFQLFVKNGLAINYQNLVEQMHFRAQHTWICDQNHNVLVDYVLRYERLQEELNDFLSIQGRRPVKLPSVNVSHVDDYRQYFDDEMIRITEEVYSVDVSMFQYRFGSLQHNKNVML